LNCGIALSCSLVPLITAWSGVQSLAVDVRAVVVVVVAAPVVVSLVVVSRVVAGAVALVRAGSSTN
jgi:hypothetical protein